MNVAAAQSERRVGIEEAAEMVGASVWYVRAKARDGEIPYFKIGRRWTFLPSDLLAFVASKRLGGKR